MGNIVLLTCGLMFVAASMKEEATQLFRPIAKTGHIEEPLITERQSDCGSCYGAKENSCCNTCAEVKEAYDAKEWVYGRFTQCDVYYILLKSDHECKSNDKDLGDFTSLEECKDACRNMAGCNFFIFGKDTKQGNCYWEKTSDSSCTEGWEKDKYDFYELPANARWSEDDPDRYCKNSIFDRKRYGPLDCQKLCEADSGCVGIARSQNAKSGCYLCQDDRLSEAISGKGYGFYRKPGKKCYCDEANKNGANKILCKVSDYSVSESSGYCAANELCTGTTSLSSGIDEKNKAQLCSIGSTA